MRVLILSCNNLMFLLSNWYKQAITFISSLPAECYIIGHLNLLILSLLSLIMYSDILSSSTSERLIFCLWFVSINLHTTACSTVSFCLQSLETHLTPPFLLLSLNQFALNLNDPILQNRTALALLLFQEWYNFASLRDTLMVNGQYGNEVLHHTFSI